MNPISKGKIQEHEYIHLKIKMKFTEQRQEYTPEHVSCLINYSTVTVLCQKCFPFSNFNSILL